MGKKKSDFAQNREHQIDCYPHALLLQVWVMLAWELCIPESEQQQNLSGLVTHLLINLRKATFS